MDRWKAEMGRVREKRRVEERRWQKRKSQKKEDADARKGRKVAKHCVFPRIWGPEGWKVGSLKRRVRSHFWPDERWKSARRCGAKHISKSKCTKYTRSGLLLAVAMSKKCTPLWREAHFEVKMYKTHHVRPTSGRSELISRGRRKGLCTFSKVSKTSRFCSIFNYNHHYITLHSNTLHYNYSYNFTTFHYTPLHSTTLHYTQLNTITFNYITLH